MYLSEKSQTVDFYKEEHRNMMNCDGNGGLSSTPQQPALILPDSSSEDHELKMPKKRAETWGQEEIICFIGIRRELDALFNTSKSNKHLWDQISAKMREKGYDRSPSMCTDKWRNLLKEFKKAKMQAKGSGRKSVKLTYYEDIDELLKRRSKNSNAKSTATSKMDSYMECADKGFDDASIPFGPVEASGAAMLGMEGTMEHVGHSLAITGTEALTNNGANPWNWRDASTNGGDDAGSFVGRVILVKCGQFSKRIGIDGTSEAIKEAIKCAFGLRTRRAFWLEDETEVVRSIDRDMPIGNYTLHLDEGVTVKICAYDGADRLTVCTEDKTFYGEEDFQDFLTRRGWTGLRDIRGFRTVDTIGELSPGGAYHGARFLVN